MSFEHLKIISIKFKSISSFKFFNQVVLELETQKIKFLVSFFSFSNNSQVLNIWVHHEKHIKKKSKFLKTLYILNKHIKLIYQI